MLSTSATRRESWEATQPTLPKRREEVYALLQKHSQGLSAWQIARYLNRDVYTVRPRITELYNMGIIECTGKRFEPKTNRKEAVWSLPKQRLKERQFELF